MDQPIAALVPPANSNKEGNGQPEAKQLSDLTALQERLRTVFGFAEFRPGQAEIVSAPGACARRAHRRRITRRSSKRCGGGARSSLRSSGSRPAAYVVFADKTLIDMARRKPATVAEMSAVHNVRATKLRQHGEIFLDVIRQHAAEQA